MTNQLYAVPGIGGTTSTEVNVEQTSPFVWAVLTMHSTVSASSDSILAAARRALDGGPRDRLAALREAAARRTQAMSMHPDTPEEIADRAAQFEGFSRLQSRTTIWHTED